MLIMNHLFISVQFLYDDVYLNYTEMYSVNDETM